jgi:hypothetical protein
MTERKLLWYKFSEADPERHYWNFLIINAPREIGLIKQNLYDCLKPIIAEETINKSRILASDLIYELFCLETTVCEIDFSKVYRGKVREDRRLYPRKRENGWNEFLDKIYLGDI